MALDPYTPYPTSPTVARNLITEVDTGYLFGVEKSEVAVTDLPVVVPVGYQMSKLGPFRVTGRLTTLGQSRVTSAASPITGLILPAENISVAYLAGATYTNVQDYINTMTSPGLITGGDVANAGGGNITVAAGTAMLRIADDDVATLKFVDFPAATLAIPNDGANRYIGLVYDNGNPHVELRTTFTWDNDTEIALGSVIQADGFMFTFSNPFKTGDPLTNIIQRFDSILPTNRDVVVGGLTLGETGTRSITMTAGRTWSRLNDHDIAAIDTSAGSFFATFYYDGATWQFSGFNQTQWDNLQYNDITSGLVAMTAGYYANIWFYIHAGHGYMVAIYGQNQYLTLAGALAESGPGITPPNWTIHTLPIAKLTFQKSAATASQIAQAYTSPFSTVPVSAHNDLTGLQGGAAAEYYHLSASEYTGTGTGNFVRLNSPVLTGTPGAPTAAPGTNTTQLATTAFVTAAIAAAAPPVTSVFGRIGAVVAVSGDYTVAQVTGAAPLASPTFTGIPAAPTPITADNSTTIATTAFVKNQGYLTGNQTITLTGDVTGSGATSIATTLTTAQPGAHTWAAIQTISNATASTSTITGALVITGGVGIGGVINAGTGTHVFGINAGAGNVISNNGAAGMAKDFKWATAGVSRWIARCSQDAETGSNAGSTFNFFALSDAGSNLDGGAGWLQVTRAAGGTILVGGSSNRTVNISTTTASTSPITGALTVGGGVGIAGAVFVAGTIRTNSTTISSSTTTGAIICDGGLGVAGALNVGNTANFLGAPNIYVVDIAGGVDAKNWDVVATANLFLIRAVNDAKNNYVQGIKITRSGFTITSVTIPTTTASTTTTSGALVVAGGVGVGGALNAAGNISVTPGSGNGNFICNAAASGSTAALLLQTNGVARWRVFKDGTAESGSDAGSIFGVTAFTDAGASIDSPLSIIRASGGLITLGGTTNRQVKCAATTASTSTITGSLIASGGVGVGGALFLDGATTKVLSYTNATPNGAVAVTFGAVGPTGSTAGNQQGWMRVNMGGTDRYVPFW